jgi:acyl-coenzyme A thioesterase PaaI-like protein
MSGPLNESLPEFSADMGIEYLGVVEGATTLELELSQKHMSRANRVHGGVLFTLLDTDLTPPIVFNQDIAEDLIPLP